MTRQAQFQTDKKAKRLGKIVGGKQQRTESSKLSASLKSLKYFWVKTPAFKHRLQLSAPSPALCTVSFTYPILQKVSLKVCSGCFVFQLLDSKMAVKRQCKWIYCYITHNKTKQNNNKKNKSVLTFCFQEPRVWVDFSEQHLKWKRLLCHKTSKNWVCLLPGFCCIPNGTTRGFSITLLVFYYN